MTIRLFKRTALSTLLVAASLTMPAKETKAAADQLFFYNTFNNPAMMDFFTKTFYGTVGTSTIFPHFKFNGVYAGQGPGTSKSNKSDSLPYLNIMYRFHPAWVVGFDISNPYYDNMNYKTGVAPFNKTVIKTKYYNGKLAYQVFDNFTLGLGLYYAHGYHIEFNFPVPGARQLRNKGKGGTWGFDAGFLWKVQKGTYFNGSFWSGKNASAHGTSVLQNLADGAILNTTRYKQNTNSPDTFSLNLIQYLSKEWLVSATTRYVLWKPARKVLSFYNSAFVPVLDRTLNYKNSWVFQLLTRYEFTPQWAGAIGFDYGTSPQRAAENAANFPVGRTYVVRAGVQYMPTENWTLTVGGAYGGYKTTTNQPTATVVKSHVNAPEFDVNITYKF